MGHLILHSHLPKNYLSDKTHKLVESQANRFASAFMMPVGSFKKDVWMTTLEAFKGLKKQWKVSIGAIIYRCETLGLFGDDESKIRKMWIKYKKDWRAIEEESFEFEMPELMKRCVDVLLESKTRSKSQILFDVPFLQNDVEDLLNLREGYLSETFGELKYFPTIKPEESRGHPLASGQVVSIENRRKN